MNFKIFYKKEAISIRLSIVFIIVMSILTLQNTFAIDFETNNNENIIIDTIKYNGEIFNIFTSDNQMAIVVDERYVIFYDTLFNIIDTISTSIKEYDNIYFNTQSNYFIISKGRNAELFRNLWEKLKLKFSAFFGQKSSLEIYNLSSKEKLFEYKFEGDPINYDFDFNNNILVVLVYKGSSFYLHVVNVLDNEILYKIELRGFPMADIMIDSSGVYIVGSNYVKTYSFLNKTIKFNEVVRFNNHVSYFQFVPYNLNGDKKMLVINDFIDSTIGPITFINEPIVFDYINKIISVAELYTDNKYYLPQFRKLYYSNIDRLYEIDLKSKNMTSINYLDIFNNKFGQFKYFHGNFIGLLSYSDKIGKKIYLIRFSVKKLSRAESFSASAIILSKPQPFGQWVGFRSTQLAEKMSGGQAS